MQRSHHIPYVPLMITQINALKSGSKSVSCHYFGWKAHRHDVIVEVILKTNHFYKSSVFSSMLVLFLFFIICWLDFVAGSQVFLVAKTRFCLSLLCPPALRTDVWLCWPIQGGFRSGVGGLISGQITNCSSQFHRAHLFFLHYQVQLPSSSSSSQLYEPHPHWWLPFPDPVFIFHSHSSSKYSFHLLITLS